MWQIIKIILKQALIYTGKYLLRQTGIFGAFGSIKKIITSQSKMKAFMKLLNKNMLKKLGKFNFFIDIQKQGFAYALKRVGVAMTPMEIKKLYYFLSPIAKKSGDSLRIRQNKKKVWKKIADLDNDKKVATIDKLVRANPNDRQEAEAKKQLLNHTFWFLVASPESGNFSVLPQYANITQRTYGVPIRGELMPIIKYYHFDNLGAKHWPIVKKAMTTGNYGKEVYSKIRSVMPPSRKLLLKVLLYKNK